MAWHVEDKRSTARANQQSPSIRTLQRLTNERIHILLTYHFQSSHGLHSASLTLREKLKKAFSTYFFTGINLGGAQRTEYRANSFPQFGDEN